MKKLMVALLLLVVTSSIAYAQAEPWIGMFEDQEYVICYGDIEVYVTKNVYMAAYLPPEILAITAVEFRVEALPETGALGMRVDAWETDLVIGDPAWGISLAFTTPVPGPWAYLGHFEFFMIDPTWIVGPDYMMAVMESNDSGNLVIVDDNYDTYDALGGRYFFFCSNPADCECLEGTATEEANWGSIKALY